MILLDKIESEIENLTKLKEILEKTEVESVIDINCKLENQELDKMFGEAWEQIKAILKIKGLNIEVKHSLKNYASIYEDNTYYFVNVMAEREHLKIKKMLN